MRTVVGFYRKAGLFPCGSRKQGRGCPGRLRGGGGAVTLGSVGRGPCLSTGRDAWLCWCCKPVLLLVVEPESSGPLRGL